MKLRNNRYAYRAMADDGAGAGGAADGAAAVPADPAATGEATGSVLAGGKEGTEAPALIERVQEKYRVLKADGTLDMDATLAKQADGYNELSKRIGKGDLPPASADEYAPEGLPEGVNIEELKADPLYQSFLKGAHAKGLSNEQVSYVLNEYMARAPDIAKGAQTIDVEACATQLKAEWKDEATFQTNLKAAYRVTAAVAEKAGIPMAEIEGSPIANDPRFLRLMAALGPEFSEAQSLSSGTSIAAADFDSQLQEIRSQEGYNDANHPQHKALMQRKQDLYAKRYGTAPAPGVTKV
ncbi:hypothetical protein [Arenimonas alkanexedens]